MTTSIFFNGRTTSIPGSYSEVDASGLAVVGLSATGIVAILGEVEGGSPYNGDTPIHRITSPGAVGRTFRQGDIVEAAAIAFDPAKDPNVPGGAAELRVVKVNPATRSTLTLLDDAAADSLVVSSQDYGLHTTQINIDVSSGTNQGKAIEVILGSTTETFDDVGGDTVWTTTFTQGTNALSTVTVALDNTTGVTGAWTRAQTGLDGDLTAAAPGAEQIQIVSDDAGDTTQEVTIYGIDASGEPQTETLTLSGTTPVVGTATWGADGVLGVVISAVTAGDITIASNPTTTTVVFTVTAGDTDAGVVLIDNAAVQLGTAVTINTSSAPGAARNVVVFGWAGQTAKGEVIAVSASGDTAGTDVDWTEVTLIAMGDTDAAVTWTISASAFVLGAAYDTVTKVVAAINDLTGWAASVPGIPGQNPGALLIANLDELAATSALTAINFLGDLAFVIAKINAESSLISVAKASGATAPPANTTNPLYLTGGIEGATAFADWQAALDLLRDELVSTVVVLTSDPAVHAALHAHCVYMGGPGRMERDGVVGGAASVTKSSAQTQVIALNSRHLRYAFQNIERYNTSGVRESFPPFFLAAAIAGAQAGSDIGESLTFKYFNALDVTQDSSIIIQDQSNELIQSGMWFLAYVSGVGWRCVRNRTTYLIDSNLAYTEASVNEAVNYTAYNLRTNLDIAVGRKGFQRTVNQVLSVAVDTLNSLIDEEVLVNWRNIAITLTADVMEVDVEVAPVNPVNFVKTTLHLVSAEFAAAA